MLVTSAVLALAGCGDDVPVVPAPAPDGVPAASEAPGLQVRAVLGPSADLDCDRPFPGNAPADAESRACDLAGAAFRLGPAAVVGGVERVTVSRLPGLPGRRALGVRLEQDAALALRELVSGAASSDSRVAVVADGTVLNTVDVASTVGGRLLLVSVQASPEQAREYAARLAP